MHRSAGRVAAVCVAVTALGLVVAVLGDVAGGGAACLVPDVELQRLEVWMLDGGGATDGVGAELSAKTAVVLALCDLQPSSAYEVRVSYLGTEPCYFRLSLGSDSGDAGGDTLSHGRPGGRDLLDIEKIVVHTNEQARVVVSSTEGQIATGLVRPIVTVEAVYDAVSVVKPELMRRPVLFNIVLETLVLGVLPRRTIPLLVVLFAALAVVFGVIYPRLLKFLFHSPLPSDAEHEARPHEQ